MPSTLHCNVEACTAAARTARRTQSTTEGDRRDHAPCPRSSTRGPEFRIRTAPHRGHAVCLDAFDVDLGRPRTSPRSGHPAGRPGRSAHGHRFGRCAAGTGPRQDPARSGVVLGRPVRRRSARPEVDRRYRQPLARAVPGRGGRSRRIRPRRRRGVQQRARRRPRLHRGQHPARIPIRFDVDGPGPGRRRSGARQPPCAATGTL